MARISATAIELAALPERCRGMARRATSAQPAEALPARVALAGCVAEAAFDGLSLLDCQDSVIAVDDAAAPSFALLASVIAAGDPAHQLAAEHARAELYLAMIARMAATVPAPAEPTDAARALHATRTELLDALLAPWRDHAAHAYERVVAIAKANPRLARDAAAQAAVRASQRYLDAHPRPAAAAPQDPDAGEAAPTR